MNRLSIPAALLALFIFGQCKRNCSGIPEGEQLLKTSEVNSIVYKGKDSVVFMENETLVYFKSDSVKPYTNHHTLDTECKETAELQGRQFVFKDTTANPIIYHNQSVYTQDYNTSYFTITYRNRNFGFPYTYLQAPTATPSFSINGKTYKNVFRLKSANDSIYYSIEKGIIRIKLESGFVLNLP